MTSRLDRRGPSGPRSALVTGASSGLGAAFAEALPAHCDLLLVARDGERLEAVRRLLEPARGERKVRICAADLTEPTGLASVLDAAEEAAPDLLVNNAGAGRLGDFLEVEPDATLATVRLNVEAPLRLAGALLPGMLARAAAAGRRAGLINVSSAAAFAPVPRMATYAASKAFLLSWSEALASELRGRPIDVLTLCPGATRSEFGRRAGFTGGQLPGALPPERVARAALAALGRRQTLVTGPEGLALSPLALGRAGLGAMIGHVTALAIGRRGG